PRVGERGQRGPGRSTYLDDALRVGGSGGLRRTGLVRIPRLVGPQAEDPSKERDPRRLVMLLRRAQHGEAGILDVSETDPGQLLEQRQGRLPRESGVSL